MAWGLETLGNLFSGDFTGAGESISSGYGDIADYFSGWGSSSDYGPYYGPGGDPESYLPAGGSGAEMPTGTTYYPDVDAEAPSYLPSPSKTPDKQKDGGFSLSKIAQSFLTPGGISALITAGGGLASGMMKLDEIKRQEAQAREDAKFEYLLELAKLKYGPKPGGGGGGGSTRNKNEDLIAVLNAGANRRIAALQGLSSNYSGALK